MEKFLIENIIKLDSKIIKAGNNEWMKLRGKQQAYIDFRIELNWCKPIDINGEKYTLEKLSSYCENMRNQSNTIKLFFIGYLEALIEISEKMGDLNEIY